MGIYHVLQNSKKNSWMGFHSVFDETSVQGRALGHVEVAIVQKQL